MLAYDTMPKAPEATNASSPGPHLDRLVEIMRILRSPGGCPWDREQTLSSLRPFIIEETYEVLAAIDASDTDDLRDELGDFVFQAVFLAQLCSENDQFTLADALRSVCEKLIRRHPHVFNTTAERETGQNIQSSTDVKRRWEEIKAAEQEAAGRQPTLLGGLPDGLPALLRGYRMGRRAATVGFDWKNVSEVVDKVDEELGEVKTAMATDNLEAIEEELGDLLFAVANLGRHLGLDPETALQLANRKFSRRFGELEHRFKARGVSLQNATLNDMQAEWERIKHKPSLLTKQDPRRS